MTRRRRARRTEDKKQRRDDILDAAERMIARHGVAGVTFGHVAKQSRLSRSLIYVYFPTHDELIYAVCVRGLVLLQARLEEAMKRYSRGLDQVLAMAAAYQAFADDEPLYFKVISELEAKQTDPSKMSAAEQSASDCGRLVLGLVAQTVQRGLKDGSIRTQSKDPMLTALSVWAFTHGLIQISTSKRYMLEDDFSLTANQLLSHGFEVLRASLAGGSNRSLPAAPARRRK
ncbi:hypothetical protein DB347_03290 [Opitutaceae bacterium EW11]|nr:hypothetical protein DB347_03290 [Opitutaceae bacterium EW11]